MADIIRSIEPFELTQGFGGNYDAYKKFGLKGHNGWDFRTKFIDTPAGRRYILASWLSKFYKQANEGLGGFGKYFEVIVKLDNTWKLTYAHCHSIESFTTRTEGQHMGISNNTGNSTSSHLHLTVKKGQIIGSIFQHDNPSNGFFGAVNPQDFFNELRAFKKKGNIVTTGQEAPQSNTPQTPPSEETIPQVTPEVTNNASQGSTGSETLPTVIPDDAGSSGSSGVDSTIVEPPEPTATSDVDGISYNPASNPPYTPPNGQENAFKAFIASIVAFLLRALEWLKGR